MTEELRKNLEQEKRIINEILQIEEKIKNISAPEEKRFYHDALNSLKKQLAILNEALVPLIKGRNYKPHEKKDASEKNTVKLSYISPSTKQKNIITIKKSDRAKFIKELSISESNLKKLKKQGFEENIIPKKPSRIARVSNIFFGKISERLAGNFADLKKDLREANIRFPLPIYLSIALFSILCIFLFSIIVFLIGMVFAGILNLVWIPFALAFLSAVIFYIYPSLEKSSVNKKISDELPFAAIYMASIAGADIEPARVLKIIAMSPEYVNIGFEIKKVVNQIDIYGYDLVTALRNISRKTPNKKLADLFNGLAVNITSGGDLKDYLEKKAQNLLADYRIERQTYSKYAETFMDIYISILITAPLILIMMFVIMNVTGLGIGISMNAILVIAIGMVIVVNILFLLFLQIKQPKT